MRVVIWGVSGIAGMKVPAVFLYRSREQIGFFPCVLCALRAFVRNNLTSHKGTKGKKVHRGKMSGYCRRAVYTTNGFKLVVFFASFAQTLAFLAVKILTAKDAKILAKCAKEEVQFLPVCGIEPAGGLIQMQNALHQRLPVCK